MRKSVFLAGLLLLAGCVSPSPQKVAALNAFVGRPEADLVRAYGVPTRSFETGGSKFLAYAKSRIQSFPSGPAFGYGYGFYPYGWGAWGGYPEVEQFDCETTFELQGGVVKSWNLRGNDC